jgi:hypothetical protein
MVRRVGSLRAEKVASRLAEYLTIRLCIILRCGVCQGAGRIYFDGLILRDLLGEAVHWFPYNHRNPRRASRFDRLMEKVDRQQGG